MTQEEEERTQRLSRRAVISGSCVAAVAGISALVLRWHSIDFGDLPTWLATVAAVVGGTVALYQLREQRKAITEEFARQRKRDALLDAQLEQVRTAHAAALRAQADQIDLRQSWGGQHGSQTHAVVVRNESPRPIRHVVARLELRSSGTLLRALRYSGVEGPGGHGDGWEKPLLRSQESVQFDFEALAKEHPDIRRSVEFEDDAGLKWRIDHDLSLRRIAEFSDL